MKTEKAKLIEAAQVLLPLLREGLDTVSRQMNDGAPEENTCAQVAGVFLRGSYIRSTYETLLRLVNGESVNYEALKDSITLEMLANSNAWSELRLWARRMS